jgi:hypothetical protein
MSEKLFLMTIGYNSHIILKDSAVVTHILKEAVFVKQEYIDGKYIYSLETNENIKCETIAVEKLRSLTVEEKKNKELASATIAAYWARKEAEKLKEQVEELKCQLKVALTKEVV